MKKIRFGDLPTGAYFKHNCFIFEKGGCDAGRTIWGIGKRVKVNATNKYDNAYSAYFADHVKVEPINLKNLDKI